MTRPLTICGIGAAASTHVVNRLRCFAERGHRVLLIDTAQRPLADVTVIVPANELRRRSWLLNRLDLISRRILGRPLPGLTTLSLLLLPELIERLNPDLLHVHYAYSFWAWMAAAIHRRPIIVSVMGGDILFGEQGAPTPRGRQLTIDLLRRASLVTAKSAHLVRELTGLGIDEEKTLIVNWGIDHRLFHPVESTALRAQLGLEPDQPVIFSPRLLQPFYNIHLLIAAMPEVLKVVPTAVLLIAEHQANAAYREDLLAQITALGLTGRVRLVGDLRQDELAAWYSLASVVVAVPPSDGLPQSLLEAMACGAPCLLSRLPRYEEVVTHGESAWLVEIEPPAIAAGLVRLLQDPELRRRLARNGRAIVREKANFNDEVSRVEAQYRALAGSTTESGWRMRAARIATRVTTIIEFSRGKSSGGQK